MDHRQRRGREGYAVHPPNSNKGHPQGGRPGGAFANGAPPGKRGAPLDIHELQKLEAFAEASAACDNHFEKSRPCPSAPLGVSDQYLVLDSYEKVETDSRGHEGVLRFNFAVQGVTRDQAIGVKDVIDTVIGVQVLEFPAPLFPADAFDPADLLALDPALARLGLAPNGAVPPGDDPAAPTSQTPFGGRVTLFLREIGLQSFSDTDNRRHHFEFKTERLADAATPAGTNDRLLLKPLRHGHYYVFTEPIKDVHGLTLCFYNPQAPLRLPPDCLYGAEAFSSDPGQLLEFRFLDKTNLLNLAPGDRIHIRGFSVPGAPFALLNRFVGRAEGFLVGAAGFSLGPASPRGTPVTFRLNPDISLAALGVGPGAALASTRITVCVAKNRLRVPLRFRRVVDRLTNYIAP